MVHAELQGIRDLVAGATLPSKIQLAILTIFDTLPKLYDDLNRTYETRFSDRIVGSAQGIVRILAAEDACPDAPELATTMVNRMRAMHDRFGISVALKPLPSPRPTRKKKAAPAHG